ncbi:MAG TPA: ATP-binding protein [Longimicrobium sp.]|nr:ATP-binding protein [Longimicrobium sp.]
MADDSSQTRAAPLPGEPGGTGSSVLDPTELQYRLLVERVHDYAIFLMDRDGFVTHWGEGAERIKEFAPEQVVGRHLSFLYPPEGAEDGTAEEHLDHAAQHGEYIGEGMRRARDRGTFPARVVLTALRRDGELHGFSKVTQDLTERRRVEHRLREAIHAAEAASVEKSRFLATMSHEIRTPINAILGYADLLALEIEGRLSDGQRTYVERVRASGMHLLSLIEDVLDFARVEAGRLAVEPGHVQATPTVDTALALVRPQAEARGIVLELDCDPEARYWADETRVRQILVNLLGNAAKFTAPGGTIRVVCGCAEPEPPCELHGPGPWTCVRVEDTGIGIPADRLASVFEPFVQVDNALTRAHQGTGLGLAISRRLARLMGGDLTVRSTPGQGSVFTLWLPSSPQALDAVPEAVRGPALTLTRVGHYVASASADVVARLRERLRVDPLTPQARERTTSEIEDHMPTLLTDLSQALVVLEEDGPDASSTAADGRRVQTLLAELHGYQRVRLGWSREGLAREYAILREELDRALDDARALASADAVNESRAVVHRLLAAAAEVSLRAYDRAAADSGDN